MSIIQKEISVLNRKIDTLHEIVDNLNYQIQEFLAQNYHLPNQNTNSSSLKVISSHTYSQDYALIYQESPPNNYNYKTKNTIDNVIDDNSVLEDIHLHEDYHQNHSLPDLSPDLQVQRLTAQLTAAYNRIAALEEQLLSLRV